MVLGRIAPVRRSQQFGAVPRSNLHSTVQPPQPLPPNPQRLYPNIHPNPQPAAPQRRRNDSELSALAEAHSEFIRLLHPTENDLLDGAFRMAEDMSGFKRETLAYGFLILATTGYLLFGSLAELVCNVIGYGYPAYASVKALRTATHEDDQHWLTYWTVFGSFALVDFFAEQIVKWIPFYWLAKSAFLMYLAAPQTRGAQRLFNCLVCPAVDAIDKSVIGPISATISVHLDEDAIRTARDDIPPIIAHIHHTQIETTVR